MTLPQPLLEFIERYVDSIETLDPAIDSHFAMREGTAGKRVQALLQNGLVTKLMPGGYRGCCVKADGTSPASMDRAEPGPSQTHSPVP